MITKSNTENVLKTFDERYETIYTILTNEKNLCSLNVGFNYFLMNLKLKQTELLSSSTFYQVTKNETEFSFTNLEKKGR